MGRAGEPAASFPSYSRAACGDLAVFLRRGVNGVRAGIAELEVGEGGVVAVLESSGSG